MKHSFKKNLLIVISLIACIALTACSNVANSPDLAFGSDGAALRGVSASTAKAFSAICEQINMEKVDVSNFVKKGTEDGCDIYTFTYDNADATLKMKGNVVEEVKIRESVIYSTANQQVENADNYITNVQLTETLRQETEKKVKEEIQNPSAVFPWETYGCGHNDGIYTISSSYKASSASSAEETTFELKYDTTDGTNKLIYMKIGDDLLLGEEEAPAMPVAPNGEALPLPNEENTVVIQGEEAAK